MLYQSVLRIWVLKTLTFVLAMTAVAARDGKVAKTTQMIAYEDMITGVKLVESVIQTHRTTTANHCALLCNKHPDCLSFNFCNFVSCELNSEDNITSACFQFEPKCKYLGMRKEFLPLCEENGKEIDVSVIGARSNCKFYKNRVPPEWGPWESTTTTMDSAHERIQVQRRQPLVQESCVMSAGGSERLVTWLHWERDPETWENARVTCKEQGGNLFSNVDGSQGQLNFFMQKMNYKNQWLGISTMDHQTWVAVNGSSVSDPNLLWNPNQPDNRQQSQYCVSNVSSGQGEDAGLNDAECTDMKVFICDMM